MLKRQFYNSHKNDQTVMCYINHLLKNVLPKYTDLYRNINVI